MPAKPDALDEQPGGPPQWLSSTERAAWLSLLALTSRLPSVLDAQLQRDAGLTLFEYTVLAVLSEQPTGTLRMSQLAGLAQGSPSRLSHVVAKLERAGLVVRQPCADDGRFTDAILTTAGVARVRRAAPAHVASVRGLVFDQLTSGQLAQLSQLTETILAQILPDPDSWPGPTQLP